MDLKAMEEQFQMILGQRCSFRDLFSESFIVKHTVFMSFQEFEKALPFNLNNFHLANDAKLNRFVNDNTKCTSWQQFVTAATIFFKNISKE